MLLFVLLACGEDADVATAGAPPSPLDATWVATLVREPARFDALINLEGKAGTAGWIALHGNKWGEAFAPEIAPSSAADSSTGAASGTTAGATAGAATGAAMNAGAGATTGAGATAGAPAGTLEGAATIAVAGTPAETTKPGKRAAAELAVFHGVLAELSNETWRTLGTTWERRGTLPTDSTLPTLVALAAKDAGDPVGWARWQKLPARPDTVVDARVALHEALRKGDGDALTVAALGRAALVEEPIPGGHRAFWDPMLHLTLSQGYGRAIVDGYPTDTLERTAFSGMIDPADGAPAASLAKLGLAMPPQDDAEACRELVRAFDRQLDPWKVQLTATAPEPGKALLTDLRLVEGLRSRALVDWGVDALGTDRPRCALAFAEMALDHEHPRAITPLNSPTLYAVSAAANLRTGRTREALDALEVLVGPFPETLGLDETVGDLAVLQGLDRAGDSREQ